MGRRTRATLILLAVLWAAAAAPAVGATVHLLRERATVDRLGHAVDALVVELQEERRLSTGDDPVALSAQRARTDRAGSALRAVTGGWTAFVFASGPAGRADELLGRVAALGETRAAVDGHRIGRDGVLDAYSGIVGPGVAAAPGPAALNRAREMFAQEDALLSGALGAPGGLSDDDRARLADLAGGRRALLAGTGAAVGPGYGPLPALETRILLERQPAVGTAQWAATAGPARAALREAQAAAVRDATRASPTTVATILYTGLVGGFGLVAVAAAIGSARRATATPAAGAPAPAADAGDRRLRDLLLDLHQRSQQLVHRQLRLLDGMQRRQSDDETLGELFRVDHLANRMRRQAEKAIMLAGGTPGRRWRRPVPLVDVVRGAASATAGYERVSTGQVEAAELAGSAVTDVTHLVAELVDNATTYSPSQTRVRVSGHRHDGGYTLTVADSGPGMTDDDLATAHQVLADPAPPGGGTWGGLYAAGRFAERQGVTVALRRGTAGGLTAELTLPAALLVATGVDADDRPTADIVRAAP